MPPRRGSEPSPAQVIAQARARYGADHPIDTELWFRHDGCDGQDYLTGNPHTFRGHIGAYCPHDDHGFTITKSDVTSAATSAWVWVDGYLAGAEPGAQQLFGPDVHHEGDDDERWLRWRELVRDFRRSGTWTSQDWWDPQPVPDEVVRQLSPAAPAFAPWTTRGVEVWSWRNSGWGRVRPQPELHDGYLADSVCRGREEHDEVEVSDVQSICRDCGSLTEYG